MPKAILEYNLPEDQDSYETAMKGADYAHMLWSFDQEFLRANTKYGVQQELLNTIRTELEGYQGENKKQADSLSDDLLRGIAECVLEVVRTRYYEYMNNHNANPFS